MTEPSQESSEPVASQGNALGDYACAFQTKENVALNKGKIIGEKIECLSHSLPSNTGNLLLMAFYKASYKVLQKDERNKGKPSCLQMSYTLR